MLREPVVGLFSCVTKCVPKKSQPDSHNQSQKWVLFKFKWLSKPRECQVRFYQKKVKSIKNVKVPEIASQILESYQKFKPIKNVKVSGIASQILKCCNNRVMCKQGSEQCWAKKEKDKQKVSWFITRDGSVINQRAGRLAGGNRFWEELAMCVFAAASRGEESLVVF